ncbi:MAG: hypothetical protein R3F11_16790 [Verrucomicrobiales bacterium]
MTKILITGFEPFGGADANPSAQLVRSLLGNAVAERGGSYALRGAVLPVSYDGATAEFFALLDAFDPDFIVSFGQGRPSHDEFTLERIALNLDDCPQPDNGGSIRRAQPIAPGGPLALQTTAAIGAAEEALAQAGIAAGISNHAGNYVCNHLYYRGLQRCAQPGGGSPQAMLFAHTPPGDLDADPERAARLAVGAGLIFAALAAPIFH